MTIQEIVELSPDDQDFSDQMMAFLAENVPYEFHMRKALEECFELGEVLAKTLNKSEEKRPPASRILEELGDLVLRIMLVSGKLFGAGDLDKGMEAMATQSYEAMETKLTKMHGWLKEGKLYNLKF
jgi:NTP pyrophosphatase (non-canonical NTP hydrolase)